MSESRSQSEALFDRGRVTIPGGVNSPVRASRVGGTPVFMASAEGPYLRDVDGNRYIDYIGSGVQWSSATAMPASRQLLLSNSRPR